MSSHLLADAVATAAEERFASLCEQDEPAHQTETVVGLLIPGQPCIVGGRSKSMKTTLAADLAAAIITGTPFLGLAVPRKRRVLYITRERPAAEVRAMVELSAMERDGWCEDGPHDRARLITTSRVDYVLTSDGRRDLSAYLATGDAGDVVVIDPLYLVLGETQTTDLAAMGRRLRTLCEPIMDAGCCPVLLHHTSKSTPVGEYATLDDLSGAGLSEFARSWMLLSRAAEYTGGPIHDLLTVTGTSRGAYGRHRVQLDEAAMVATVQGPTTPAPDAATKAKAANSDGHGGVSRGPYGMTPPTKGGAS